MSSLFISGHCEPYFFFIFIEFYKAAFFKHFHCWCEERHHPISVIGEFYIFLNKIANDTLINPTKAIPILKCFHK